jgi:hypothetical protein
LSNAAYDGLALVDGRVGLFRATCYFGGDNL